MAAPTFPVFVTVPQMIAAQTVAHGPRELLVSGRERLSYAEAEGRSAALADGLVALGVTKGVRVGVLLPSGVDFVITWLAATRVGAVLVPLSTFLKPEELVWQLRNADIHTLILRDGFLTHRYCEGLAKQVPELTSSGGAALDVAALPVLRNVIVDAVVAAPPSWALNYDQVACQQTEALPVRLQLERMVRAADDAVIVYTSGSTAEPKGVIHSQGTLVRHPVNVNVRRGLVADDRMYLALPLFWVGGFSQGLVGAYVAGACAIVDEVFVAERALAVMERERVTVVSGWPFHADALRASSDYATRDLSSLRTDIRNLLTSPDAPVALEAWPTWIGMTETFGAHLLAPMDARLPPHLLGSFGSTLPGLEHRIVDPGSGDVAAAGDVGELHVRGYAVMQGYVGKEREETFTSDGYFRTGDLGYFSEEGHFFLTGRLSDVIKTSGSNVSPAEVADVLQRVKGVAVAHVIGIPDEQKGEVVAAALVARPGAELDLDAVSAAAKRELSAFKVPRHLVQLTAGEIPMTATGKVSRGQLRKQLVELIFAEGGSSG